MPYAMTRNDLLAGNADLLAHCVALLRQQPLSAMSVAVDKPGKKAVCSTQGLDRIDAFVDGHPTGSFAIAEGGTCEVPFTAASKQLDVAGFKGASLLQRRRIVLKAWRSRATRRSAREPRAQCHDQANGCRAIAAGRSKVSARRVDGMCRARPGHRPLLARAHRNPGGSARGRRHRSKVAARPCPGNGQSAPLTHPGRDLQGPPRVVRAIRA
jgi:hypothetical protein